MSRVAPHVVKGRLRHNPGREHHVIGGAGKESVENGVERQSGQ